MIFLFGNLQGPSRITLASVAATFYIANTELTLHDALLELSAVLVSSTANLVVVDVQ